MSQPPYFPYRIDSNPASFQLVEDSTDTSLGTLYFVRSPHRTSAVATLFLRGVASTWTTWTPLLRAAADDGLPLSDLILVDLPGFGRSQRIGDNLEATEIGTTLVSVAQGLGNSQVRVVGHSMGGFLALDMARLVKSFAAAGVANRVVAIFDNDSAAADAMRTLNRFSLPANIVATRYPNLDELREYPTLGPPTSKHPDGTQELADINGLAGSIELYLGRDVLTDATGDRLPVQWQAFIQGIGRYQGEISDKHGIQKSFRAKLARCQANSNEIENSDWSGMRHILTCLLQAFPHHSDLPRKRK